MKTLKYVTLFVGLTLVLSACGSGGTPNPVPDPDSESPVSMVLAPEDSNVMAIFPTSMASADEVTVNVRDEGLGLNFKDVAAASQHVRIELPTAALQQVRTQADEAEETYDGFLVTVTTNTNFPVNSLTPASTIIVVNDDYLLELPYIATSNTINIPADTLREYLEETDSNPEALVLDIQNYVFDESTLYNFETQQLPPPRDEPAGTLYTGLFRVDTSLGNLFTLPWEAEDWCESPNTEFRSLEFREQTSRFYESGSVDLTKMPLVLLHGWQGGSETYMDFHELGTPAFQHPALCGRYELIEALVDAGIDEHYDIFSFGYNSLLSIESNATRLGEAIETVLGNRPIAIVAFSMGGMVAHDYIQRGDHNVQMFFPTNSPLLGSHTLACIGEELTSCDEVFINSKLLTGGGNNPDDFRLPGNAVDFAIQSIRATARSRRYVGTRNLANAGFENPSSVPANVTYQVLLTAATESDEPLEWQNLRGWRVLDTRILPLPGITTYIANLGVNDNYYLWNVNGNLNFLDRYHALVSASINTNTMSYIARDVDLDVDDDLQNDLNMLHRATDTVVSLYSQTLSALIPSSSRTFSLGDLFDFSPNTDDYPEGVLAQTHPYRGGATPVIDLLEHSFFDSEPFPVHVELIFRDASTREIIPAGCFDPDDIGIWYGGTEVDLYAVGGSPHLPTFRSGQYRFFRETDTITFQFLSKDNVNEFRIPRWFHSLELTTRCNDFIWYQPEETTAFVEWELDGSRGTATVFLNQYSENVVTGSIFAPGRLIISGEVFPGPVEGVTVRLYSPSISYDTTTNDIGRFSFNEVEPGTYTLYAESYGYETHVREGIEVPLQSDIPVLFIDLTPLTKTILTGNVIHQDGTGIEGATVSLYPLAANPDTTEAITEEQTNADGEFEFEDIPVDDYRIVINKEGFATLQRPALLEDTDENSLEPFQLPAINAVNTVHFIPPVDYISDPLLMEPIDLTVGEAQTVTIERLETRVDPLTVRLQVFTPSSLGAEDIRIDGRQLGSNTFEVTFPALRSQTTFDMLIPEDAVDEASGRLELRIVEAPAYGLIEGIQDRPTNLTFELQQPSGRASVLGVVLDGTSRVEGALVVLSNQDGFVDRDTTLANGNFTFSNIPVGDNYTITVTATGYAELVREDISLAAGNNTLAPFELKPLETDVETEIRDFDLDICETWSVSRSGGFGRTIDNWDISQIPPNAVFDIRYNTRSIPDRIYVDYPVGTTVLDTGWRGDSSYQDESLYPGGISGSGQGQELGFFTRAQENTFRVTVVGRDNDTAWDYQVRCRVEQEGTPPETPRASVLGVVLDGTSRVEDARVVLSNQDGFEDSDTTLANGNFTFSDVPVGDNYTITVTAAGYAELVRENISLVAGDNTLQPFPLVADTPPVVGGEVCEGNFTIDSNRDDMQQVIEEVTGCGVITGILWIRQTSLENLSFLASLTSVDGNLLIGSPNLFDTGNAALTSLDGLQNLTSVGSFLSIQRNAALTSLDELQNLTSVGGDMLIEANPALTSLDGFQNLTSVGGDILISGNDALTSLDGTQNIITEVSKSIEISDNTSLDCTPFSSFRYMPVDESTGNLVNCPTQ